MSNKQLRDYIERAMRSGQTVEQIRSALLAQGWGEKEISETCDQTSQKIKQEMTTPLIPPKPPKKSEWNIELKSLSASQILLYLGAFIVVLAGIIFISINWSQWNSLARIIAILLPMLICYCLGVPMWFSGHSKKQGIVFLVTGSLLFPFFLLITFKELAIFAKPFNDYFNLTLTLLTFALYIISSLIFRFPVWSFLYYSTGLFVYYFLLKVFGVAGLAKETAMAWLLLIPSTAYLFISLRSAMKKEEGESGNYPYLIGSVAIAFSFIRLFAETYDKELLAWVLLLVGILYFILGIFSEANFKKYCEATYLIGAAVVFFSLLRLGLSGTLLKFYSSTDPRPSQDMVGWSSVVAGAFYLLIAWVMEKLKVFQLVIASRFKEFFYLVGPFMMLGAITYLGTDGNKPINETLLLLFSLGFIFGSIPKQKVQFLYIGTLFLVIYIFSIGGEYFQNNIGWPITLFVAGLISMGIGVAIEKVRKRYFIHIKT